MKRIVGDPSRCLACRTCELACALAHAGQGGQDDLVEAIFHQKAKARIYIESAGALAVPLQCRHCEDAPCVRVCPSGALWRPDEGGPVLVDAQRCIGCAFCVEVCPFGVIRLARRAGVGASESGLAVVKCDLCEARQSAGMGPACVDSCPVGALAFQEVEENAKRTRARTAMKIAADGQLS